MIRSNIHDQRLLVIDFGSQYTQLIARRVREVGVYCEIYPFDVDHSALVAFAPKGIILSGGPESVTEGETPRIPDGLLDLGVPVLGICYGMQAMAVQLGGAVGGSDVREFGHAVVEDDARSGLGACVTELRDNDRRADAQEQRRNTRRHENVIDRHRLERIGLLRARLQVKPAVHRRIQRASFPVS